MVMVIAAHAIITAIEAGRMRPSEAHDAFLNFLIVSPSFCV
jgi:hypothetical protein